MEELEQDYNDNKENCEHLVQRRNSLVLAAKPLDFMQTFRWVLIHVYLIQLTITVNVDTVTK